MTESLIYVDIKWISFIMPKIWAFSGIWMVGNLMMNIKWEIAIKNSIYHQLSGLPFKMSIRPHTVGHCIYTYTCRFQSCNIMQSPVNHSILALWLLDDSHLDASPPNVRTNLNKSFPTIHRIQGEECQWSNIHTLCTVVALWTKRETLNRKPEYAEYSLKWNWQGF